MPDTEVCFTLSPVRFYFIICGERTSREFWSQNTEKLYAPRKSVMYLWYPGDPLYLK